MSLIIDLTIFLVMQFLDFGAIFKFRPMYRVEDYPVFQNGRVRLGQKHLPKETL
jgi:hypothetical protein